MRAGAVGISLTAATHVFLLEPAMNPKLEDQAIGRAWRLGLMHPVTVKRFYVKARPAQSVLYVNAYDGFRFWELEDQANGRAWPGPDAPRRRQALLCQEGAPPQTARAVLRQGIRECRD